MTLILYSVRSKRPFHFEESVLSQESTKLIISFDLNHHTSTFSAFFTSWRKWKAFNIAKPRHYDNKMYAWYLPTFVSSRRYPLPPTDIANKPEHGQQTRRRTNTTNACQEINSSFNVVIIYNFQLLIPQFEETGLSFLPSHLSVCCLNERIIIAVWVCSCLSFVVNTILTINNDWNNFFN